MASRGGIELEGGRFNSSLETEGTAVSSATVINAVCYIVCYNMILMEAELSLLTEHYVQHSHKSCSVMEISKYYGGLRLFKGKFSNY